MFIVIDGIDGSGKWTQLQLVQEALEKKWKKVYVLDFPRYGNTSAFAVEKYLNGKYGDNVNAKQASIFYALDRYDASHEFKKYIDECDYVISNRYVSASMIHQWGKIENRDERNKFLSWLYELEYEIFQIPKPELTLFLNVSPETSNTLVEKKDDRSYIEGWSNKDIHEKDSNHMIHAFTVANEIVDEYPDWYKIECEEDWSMLPKEQITKKILDIIIELEWIK